MLEEIFIRHLTLMYLDEVPTKSKEIGPGVEMQEEQQSIDGTDGPSKYTVLLISQAFWMI
jgi:hypothetical protein